MYAKVRHLCGHWWWALPALSGLLLVLTFHPFGLWPLGFVALAPLYWFAGGFAHSRTRLVWGGFIAGGGFSFFLSYYTIAQFHWLPETYLFVWGVHALVVPIVLVGGGACALALVAYRTLRSRSVLLNAAVAAAVYALAELLLSLVFHGYYLGLLAYAATPLTPVLALAALGGAHFVSLALAFVSGLAAEALIAGRMPLRTAAAAALVVAACIVPAYAYLHRPLYAERTLRVSLVQGARSDIFGTEHAGTFFWSQGSALAAAGAAHPDLLIYPFSPVEGALYRDAAPAFNRQVLVASETAVGAFLKNAVPASTTVLTWNNLYANGRFHNAYELWRGGRVVSQYDKRHLFPFMDYSPAWAQRMGLYSTPFDVTPGAADNRLLLGDLPLGDLMCSELHDASLARQEARRAPIIIAVGSEAMFTDDVASDFSLRAAQLRAAENDVPVVRGNVLGPSGIIDRFGGLMAYAPAGEEAALSASVGLTAPRTTLYNRTGDWLVLGLICGILGSAWYASRAGRSHQSR